MMIFIRVTLVLLVTDILIGKSFAFVPLPLVLPSRSRQQVLKIKHVLTKSNAATTLVVDPPPALVNTGDENINDHSNNDEYKPLLEIKMEKIKLPRLAVGKECVTIPLHIDGLGTYEFMIDSGLTTQMVSPSLLKELTRHQKEPQNSKRVTDDSDGIAAGGSTGRVKLVDLHNVKVGNELALSSDIPFQAIVTNFAQENIDRKHNIKGMVGMEFLNQFDIDLDFPSNKIRFWAPGTAEKEAQRLGMVEVPIAVINDSLLLGTRMTGQKMPVREGKKKEQQQQQQPFLGILDTGSTFSAINWEAAKLLGLPPKKSLQYLKPPGIMAVGIDNKPLYIPTKKVKFTYCGNPIIGGQTQEDEEETMKVATAADAEHDNKQQQKQNGVIVVGFESPSKEWKPWKPVLTGIGDLPLFELVLGTKSNPFKGPAALIGMDIISQRRVILESCMVNKNAPNATSGKKDARRGRGRMFVSPE